MSSAAAEQLGHAPAIATPQRGMFALLCVAGFLCCAPMAMPPGHLVALCSDLGIAPARGALMLSVLLGSALLSRQLWGWLTDRFGGLYTILAASTCQAAALLAFVFTQDEAGLFVVSAAFGLGFSGIIPAYVVVIRQFFPAEEAGWRVPVWFFSNICGMALGGWLAGYLYDLLGSYGARSRWASHSTLAMSRWWAGSPPAAKAELPLSWAALQSAGSPQSQPFCVLCLEKTDRICAGEEEAAFTTCPAVGLGRIGDARGHSCARKSE